MRSGSLVDRVVILALALFPALVVLPGGSALAQIPDSLRVPPDSVLEPGLLEVQVEPEDADSVSSGITPRGAFLRSAVIPGWGHAVVGAHGRGAFYFLMEAVSGFMIVKTQTRLALARDRASLRESLVRSRIVESGVEDLEEIEELLAADEVLEDLRGLEEARSEQREDWLALGIFFLFLGGADAYVSAHLSDFPGAVEVNATPSGGVEVGISVPVNFR